MTYLFIAPLLFSSLISGVAFAAEDPIRIQMGGEPSTLEPARIIDQYGIGIMRNVVEGLFRLDGEGRLQNGLAAKHDISKDGLKHRFTLRADAKWSDGRVVTIEECVAGLRHAINPQTASPNADVFFAIKNARAIFEGKAAIESLGVRREGNELVIELERPDPMLTHGLSIPAASPLRNPVWSASDPVTGAYVIKKAKLSEQIELSPNPHHAGFGDGRRDVIYRIFPEEMTAMNLFDAGKVDIITTITLTELARYGQQGLIQTQPSTTVFSVSFNVTKPPFDDAEVRRAVSYAIDREGLTKALQGSYEATTSYLPKSLDGALPYRRDDGAALIARVRTRLASLPKKPVVTLAYGASAFTKIVGEKLQNDLKQKLGLDVRLEASELKTLLGRLKTDPPEMYFLGMSAVYNDPLNQLRAFSSATGPNFSRYTNPSFEKMLEDIRGLPAGEKRAARAQEANRLLTETDAATAPVVLRVQIFGVSKKVSGFQVSPYQVIQLEKLRK